MDAHPIAAFDESVFDLSQRRGGTESMALRKKAPPSLTGLSSGWHHARTAIHFGA